MSQFKSYTTLQQFLDMIKKLPVTTTYHFKCHKATYDPLSKGYLYNTSNWNCLLLVDDLNSPRYIWNLKNELEEYSKENPEAAVLEYISSAGYYKIIEKPALNYSIALQTSDTPIEEINLKSNNKVMEFVKLLNDIGTKSLSTAKALADEKNISNNPLYDDGKICYYNNKWYTLNEIKSLFPDYILDVTDAELLSPIYMLDRSIERFKDKSMNTGREKSSDSIEYKSLPIEPNADIKTLNNKTSNLDIEVATNIEANVKLVRAAQDGDEETVNKMIKLGANDYNKAMVNAAYAGNINIVNKMIKLGADKYNESMYFAAYNNHEDIIDDMIKLGADNYNRTMINAALNGHENIVRKMLQLGADSYFLAIDMAKEKGHDNIIKLIKEWEENHKNNELRETNDVPKQDKLTNDVLKQDKLTNDVPKQDKLTNDVPKQDKLTIENSELFLVKKEGNKYILIGSLEKNK